MAGAAVQIAKARGCRVTAIDRAPPSPASPAGRLIDDHVATTSDVPAEVRRLTGRAGAAVVFDAVGGVMFEPALLSLGHRGRLAEISGTGRRRVEFDAIDFDHNESRIFGADSRKFDIAGSAKLLADLAPGFESGAYHRPSSPLNTRSTKRARPTKPSRTARPAASLPRHKERAVFASRKMPRGTSNRRHRTDSGQSRSTCAASICGHRHCIAPGTAVWLGNQERGKTRIKLTFE